MLNWKYGELKLLDEIDATYPIQDLIALYSRINAQDFQIRLDFLELDRYLGNDIYILFDTSPGGITQIESNRDSITSDLFWDYLLKITDSGIVEILDDHLAVVPDVELFIVYDSLQDRIIISFNKHALPIYYGTTKLQVFITPPGKIEISDKSLSIAIDAPPPSRGKVIFAFWNTFSSITPAQTLRSWAGAHAGPMSSRHGLKYLLDAAIQNKTTIFLVDLLKPETISVLDYIDALPEIRKLAIQGLIALREPDETGTAGPFTFPVGTYGGGNNNADDFYKIWQIYANFDSNRFENKPGYISLLNSLINWNINNYIIGNNDYAHNIYNYVNCNLFPQSVSTVAIEQSGELSLACKSLLHYSASIYPTIPLVLGGDFSKSMLGDPATISVVFSYLMSHPWIEVFSINDLNDPGRLSSYFASNQEERNTLEPLSNLYGEVLHLDGLSYPQNEVYKQLLDSSPNRLTDLAWRLFSQLTQASSKELLALQSNYIGSIGFILSAANWADSPSIQATCSVDLDYDGMPECILSNSSIYLVIEPEGGYLPFIFSKDAKGIHQIVGPTWEFVVGLSDSSTWKPDLSVSGDPAQLLGAFQDEYNSWKLYNFELSDNSIVLTSTDGSIRKLFTISTSGVQVELNNALQSPEISTIPVVIDPWTRYTPGWGNLYTNKIQPFTVYWGIYAGEMVGIWSTNPLSTFSFIDTRVLMHLPEDANYDYLPGHYLPYPMSVVDVNASESYSVEILINP